MHSPIAVTCWPNMKRRSNKPPLRAFGRLLLELRGKATREQVSIKLEKLFVPLGGSTLSQYERGFVWAPDAAVLWGLATTYGVKHEELVMLLRENRRHPQSAPEDWRDLLRQSIDQISDPSRGSDAATLAADSARRLALAKELKDLVEDFRSSVSDVADRFVGDVARAPDADAIAAHRGKKANRVRGDRKAS